MTSKPKRPETRLEHRPPEPDGPAQEGANPAAGPPTRAPSSSKCPVLRDLLGDFAEQTGSLFG